MLRRWRAPYPVRRGTFYRVPSAPGQAPPKSLTGRALRWTSNRRGQFYPIVPKPVTGATGPLVGRTVRQWQRINVLARRGQFYRIPLKGLAPGPLIPPPIIQAGSHPRWAPLPRRGVIRFFPMAGQAPTTQTPIPQRIVGDVPHWAPTRRGIYFKLPPAVVPPVVIAVPPQRIVGDVPHLAPARRGSFQLVPPAVRQSAPRWITTGRKQALIARHGQFLAVPVPPAGRPGPLVGHVMRPWQRVNFLARRGQFWRFPLVGQAPPPLVAIGTLAAHDQAFAHLEADEQVSARLTEHAKPLATMTASQTGG